MWPCFNHFDAVWEPKWPKCSFYCWWQIARLVPLVIWEENTGRAISRKLYPVHWRLDSFTAAHRLVPKSKYQISTPCLSRWHMIGQMRATQKCDKFKSESLKSHQIWKYQTQTPATPHSTNVVEIKNWNIKGLKLNVKYSLYSWCHMIRESWPIASSYRLSVTQIHVDL